MNDITKNLRENHSNFDIQVLTTEVHNFLTQQTDKLHYKSTVLVQIFEKNEKEGLKPQETMTLLRKAQANGTSIKSMEDAEDIAVKRALTFLGL